jgi:hypothetical protein
MLPAMGTSDLLLHPVRLRIIKAFLGDRVLTTTQLAAELDDVPAGSLYRHVQRLAQAGVLGVVSERRVRGAVERTYVLRTSAAQVGPAEARAMGADEHRQAFTAFVAGLLTDFDRYLAAGTPDLVRDGVSYRMAAMWLTDAEYLELLRDIVAVLQPRLALPPGPARRRRLAYNVFLPAPESSSGAERLDGESPHRGTESRAD